MCAGFLMELVDRDSFDGIVFGHLVGSRLEFSRNRSSSHGFVMPRCWRYSLTSSSTSLAIGSWCGSSSLAVCFKNSKKCCFLYVCSTSLFHPIQPMSNLFDPVGLPQPVKSIL